LQSWFALRERHDVKGHSRRRLETGFSFTLLFFRGGRVRIRARRVGSGSRGARLNVNAGLRVHALARSSEAKARFREAREVEKRDMYMYVSIIAFSLF
jgi:hypothetical protein